MRPDPARTLVCLLLCLAACLVPLSAPPTVPADETRPSPPAGGAVSDLEDSLVESLAAEQAGIAELRRHLEELSASGGQLAEQLKNYRIQATTHGNLLQLRKVETSTLEEGRSSNRKALASVSQALEDARKHFAEVRDTRAQTEAQLAANRQSLEAFKDQPAIEPELRAQVSRLEKLAALLKTRLRLLERVEAIYSRRVTDYTELQATLTSLADRLTARIAAREKQGLRQRGINWLSPSGWEQVEAFGGQIRDEIASLADAAFWQRTMRPNWRGKLRGALLVLILLAALIALVLRLGRMFRRWQSSVSPDEQPATNLALLLGRRSLPLAAITLFLHVYGSLLGLAEWLPFAPALVKILTLWLFSGWFLHLHTLLQDQTAPTPTLLPPRPALRFVRFYGSVYIAAAWLLAAGSPLLLVGRLILEGVLLATAVDFWKKRRITGQKPPERHRRGRFWTQSAAALSYFICGAGLFLELLGFGALALYWYVGWGKTAVVLLWAILLLKAIREYRRGQRLYRPLPADAVTRPAAPLRWFGTQMIRLVWLLGFGLLLFMAWDASRAVLLGMLDLLGRPLAIGGLRLRIGGFFWAAVILLITHTAARVGRHLLIHRILSRSGFDAGLKDSITTISVYLLWALGIITAMHAVGFNTTSLAVAFGALGIGLGFGLQNIFNNFISGLILLFERPIQVGDAIEIGGIWGEVKKINVRSTLIQTWDNASLIIPNSEFISAQVTNWSFKDLRLRRNVTVGVAYGSDIELVRRTLREIPPRIPGVLQQPEPDVLFTDFGDSALIFRLRYWTDIDHILKTETDIRFEIDRLFRQRGIEIAFPQRDIHIRSGAAGTPSAPNPPQPVKTQGGHHDGNNLDP